MAENVQRKETEVFETPDKGKFDERNEDDSMSQSVEKLEVNTDQAFMKFRGQTLDSSQTDFSERFGRQQAAGYAARGPDFELAPECDHDKETIQQRFNRLQAEVHLLVRELEDAKVGDQSGNETETSPVQLTTQVQELQQQLHEINLEKLLGKSPGQSAADAELTRQLKANIDLFKQRHEGPLAAGSSQPHVTYELYYRPEQEKFQQLSKVTELEKRLGRLESLVGSNEGEVSALLSQESEGSKRSLMSVLSSLQEKTSLLDMNEVDQIEARLQFVLYHMNQIAEQKPAVENSDKQTKVSELFDVVKQWDAVASTLPDLIARLESLQELHRQAAEFSQSITHLDAAQQKIKEQLHTNSSLFSEAKATFRGNADAIAANCEKLEQRIAALLAKVEKS